MRPFSPTDLSHAFVVLVFFVAASWQQKDPVKDFCRRAGHQSAVIDDKLFIDGGFVNYITSDGQVDRTNYPSEFS